MKMLISCLLLSSLALHAENSLKTEVTALIKTAMADTENLPEDATPELIFKLLSEDGLNSNLSEDEAAQLNKGTPLRSPADFKATAEQTINLGKLDPILAEKKYLRDAH